ncbi:RNA polymerase sigma factor [Pedobacter sp. AW31-3R]|uniref:RNA polymerase sigma factor n=1 Tax=Pedobacter sp. AW31-3R TaxID=3445781 RepID=UPI003FA15C19
MKIVKELSDQQLLEYCRTGNDKAFDILFRRYFRPLYQLSLKYVNHPETAEELVMDLLMWVWEKRKTDICPEGNFSAYIYKAMRNSIISFFRKKTLQTETIDLLHEETLSDSRSADHDYRSKELNASFLQKLEELSPQRRTVYQMSREEEMTYPEIARKLNLSKNTVKSHMSFSLSHLRENLDTTV